MDLAAAAPGFRAAAHFLLVEDEPDDQTLFTLAVRKSGLHLSVHRVGNAREALAYLEGHPPYDDRVRCPVPDVVVLDLAMPLMNGYELLRRLRAGPHWQGLPVVVLTGCCDPVWKEKALALGADKVFEKFARLDEGAAVVHEIAGVLSARLEQPATTGLVPGTLAAVAGG